jgi:predicted nucleic-acid-binding protein
VLQLGTCVESGSAARAHPVRGQGIVAEVVYVLESFYEVKRQRVAELVRAVIGFPAIVVVDEPLLLRALEVYEVDRLDFAEAYLVASAEASGVETIASLGRTIDRRPQLAGDREGARRILLTGGAPCSRGPQPLSA